MIFLMAGFITGFGIIDPIALTECLRLMFGKGLPGEARLFYVEEEGVESTFSRDGVESTFRKDEVCSTFGRLGTKGLFIN